MIRQHLLWLSGTQAERTAYDTTPLQPPVLWYETDTAAWYFWSGAAWAALGGGGAPAPHAASHQHGGADAVGTATPTANAIPEASATGKLDGWISEASESTPGIAELATEGEAQAGVDTGRVITPATLAAVLRQPPTITFDFTGTNFDTKGKCQAYGLRFSDTDTPFPTHLRGGVSGSWSHSAGKGWRPATATDEEGPAMLIPLARGNNFEAKFTARTYSRSSLDATYVFLGVVGPGLHVAFLALYGSYSFQHYRCSGSYNNGDDTRTNFYQASSLGYASVAYELGIRFVNGVVGVYDDVARTWNYYEDLFGGYLGYPADYVFLQAWKRSGYTYHTIDIMNFSLTYLT